ncbi:solute carrier family 28 member 3-like [Amphiura filiformis]|uniref:solute carrier family 28 member 3-like n=1 Tax=Amphiura filiformis TaxID=82378 RepID=UPI003B20CBE3
MAEANQNGAVFTVESEYEKYQLETIHKEPDGHDNPGFDDSDEEDTKPTERKLSGDITSTTKEPGIQDQFWGKTDIVLNGVKEFYYDNNRYIWNGIYLLFLTGYIAYLVYACIYDFEEAMVMVIITGIVVGCVLYVILRDNFGEQVYDGCCLPLTDKIESKWKYIKWPFYFILLAGLAVALYFLTEGRPEQLISFAGLICLVLFAYIFSKYPRHVKWRPVLWGMALQFALGLFILRTKVGFMIFDFLGDLVQTFLDYTDEGSIFVFGDNYMDHFFAFKVLPVVIYFSAVIAVLYYLGTMQVVITKIAFLMQKTMQTSASESLNAAGNIFVGQTEAPLLIRPYLSKMTKSELHAIMTGGFATIAGSVLGAYISFGISASHLLSASVMSAPAALAIAKLFYPETEESQTKTADQMKLPKGQERNIIEAASFGASTAVPLVLNIAANLIAFLALLALFNGILGYLGGLVGYPELSFELICSYVFIPLAYMMGTDWEDCQIVAELIGTKTFINEFVAYERLSEYIDNRETGAGPTLSLRSEVIATYALCGFANMGSIGIQLGGLTPMAPERKGDLASVAIRALIAGTVACFMTACIAGVLYIPDEVIPGTVAPTGLS